MNRARKTESVEHSAGGLALKKSGRSVSLLMVEVKNLLGEIRWTFPKGHLEKGENNRQAALREVEEETGWICRIAPKTAFKRVRYRFKRNGKPVRKTVVWFLMEPVKKSGGRDPEEIRKVRWFTLRRAETKISYPSDLELLTKLKTKLG